MKSKSRRSVWPLLKATWMLVSKIFASSDPGLKSLFSICFQYCAFTKERKALLTTSAIPGSTSLSVMTSTIRSTWQSRVSSGMPLHEWVVPPLMKSMVRVEELSVLWHSLRYISSPPRSFLMMLLFSSMSLFVCWKKDCRWLVLEGRAEILDGRARMLALIEDSQEPLRALLDIRSGSPPAWLSEVSVAAGLMDIFGPMSDKCSPGALVTEINCPMTSLLNVASSCALAGVAFGSAEESLLWWLSMCSCNSIINCVRPLVTSCG
mmetsp:Transcript_51131/g.119792  ORF Transcript_51131/g.119792 Transcript_51131/m.119792 type:complete len:264 (-) Transcript_51131:1777-2568(-)